jgi:hypothetical protein
MEGNPRFETAHDLPNVPYAQFAGMLGLKGIFVDNPEDLKSAWAVAHGRSTGCARGQDRSKCPAATASYYFEGSQGVHVLACQHERRVRLRRQNLGNGRCWH